MVSIKKHSKILNAFFVTITSLELLIIINLKNYNHASTRN